eukprot:CAMPEP_0172566462 /NCGR_PEP_ID=MMETSP1067-20121228/111924_1 /TAXON_ID=265564 ORGANISM="Thalassiosira punctigera, Strain Tpunct2005C2" /NCGR_SAMPLE_ID=MMETSP1067 /ASSEMBLY_ACC=CAM_ASM_000444 /LENGTH=31 /DNA_ID= /DNA_START= /DNA_END= /DNA_ORIENTATION=
MTAGSGQNNDIETSDAQPISPAAAHKSRECP